MTRVRVDCYNCGEQTIGAAAIDLVIRTCGDNEAAEYNFSCPECSLFVVIPADSRTVALLLPVAHVWRESIPAEILEHPGPEVPALNQDDLLDFMLDLPYLVASLDE